MSNYNNKKGRTGRIVAGVLVGLLAVMAVAGAGTSLYMGIKNNGWFEKDEDVEQVEEALAENVSINNVESKGISLASTQVTTGPTDTTTSCTITATVTPSTYTGGVTMSVAWVNSSSTWATGKTVTDYVTIVQSSTGSLTGTLTVKQAFGEQVKINVVANDEYAASASATVDYIKRVTSIDLGTYQYSFGDTCTISPTINYGTGTLTPTVSSSYVTSLGYPLLGYFDTSTSSTDPSAYIATSLSDGFAIISNFASTKSFSFSSQTDLLTTTITTSGQFNAFLSCCQSITSTSGSYSGVKYIISHMYTYSYGDSFSGSVSGTGAIYFDCSGMTTAATGVSLNDTEFIF